MDKFIEAKAKQLLSRLSTIDHEETRKEEVERALREVSREAALQLLKEGKEQ